MTYFYKGDIGVQIDVQTNTDLTTATTKTLKIRKPSGTTADWTATVIGSASLGNLRYTTVSGDFDEVGEYRMQAYVELSSGQKFYGDVDTFTVYDTYEEAP
jgi:hypothetical protein